MQARCTPQHPWSQRRSRALYQALCLPPPRSLAAPEHSDIDQSCEEAELPHREQIQTEDFSLAKPQHSKIMSQTHKNHGTASRNLLLTSFSLPAVFKKLGCLYEMFLSSSTTSRVKICLIFIIPFRRLMRSRTTGLLYKLFDCLSHGRGVQPAARDGWQGHAERLCCPSPLTTHSYWDANPQKCGSGHLLL